MDFKVDNTLRSGGDGSLYFGNGAKNLHFGRGFVREGSEPMLRHIAIDRRSLMTVIKRSPTQEVTHVAPHVAAPPSRRSPITLWFSKDFTSLSSHPPLALTPDWDAWLTPSVTPRHAVLAAPYDQSLVAATTPLPPAVMRYRLRHHMHC